MMSVAQRAAYHAYWENLLRTMSTYRTAKEAQAHIQNFLTRIESKGLKPCENALALIQANKDILESAEYA